MSIKLTGSVTSATDVYSNYQKKNTTKSEPAKTTEQAGVVYEKGSSVSSKNYSVNKMSEEDRAALVEQLKADQQSRQEQLVNIVQKMMTEQATAYGNANDIWKFLASGDYTVDAETKLQAQKDIAEDGYYGVKQTSERLFAFASALAGDDVEKMQEMQKAMEKGFKLATKAWGKELPEISQQTLEAANQLFEEYYAAK